MLTIAKCSSCGFPIEAEYEGQKTTCAYCGEKLEAIAQTTSNTFLWSLLAFTLGVIVGPVVIASTKRGREWLERQAGRI